MSEIARIVDQLERAYDGDAWAGPSLSAVLADVSPATAAAQPLAKTHSIWEMVLHIIAWERVVVRRLSGELIVDLAETENWPAVQDPSDKAWKKTKEDLKLAHRQLSEAISRLDESRLNEVVPGKNHSVYVMLHGAVQHVVYHAGQIALLKKV